MSNKPEVFGDGYRRCLISSIAGYEECMQGQVNIYLKSGETVELRFGNDYLSDLAMKKLDGYFKVDDRESNPCNVCVRRDVKWLGDENTKPALYCDYCTHDDPYHKTDEFRPPGTNPHDDERDFENFEP